MSKTEAIMNTIECLIFGIVIIALCQPQALPWVQ